MDASARTRGLLRAASIAPLLLALAATAAADPLGLYVGAAAGQAQVEANAPNYGDFSQSHSAFKLIAGLKPIPLIGAEVEYLDFGHPSAVAPVSGAGFTFSGDVTMKGTAAFGLLYLPIPVVDIYAKGGVARLDTHANGTVVCLTTCPPLPPLFAPVSRTDTGVAAGAGVGFRLGGLGVRAEYEIFNAADHHPYLWTLGATWTF